MTGFAGRLTEKYLFPDYMAPNVYDMDFEILASLGVKGLILDIDNTLVKPGEKRPDDRTERWFEAARDGGFKVCLLSNSSRRRVAGFASGSGVFAVAKAGKPLRRGFIKAMRLLKCDASQVCVIGDQIFTDILGAKRLGLTAVLTEPFTKREEPLVALKRFPEFFIKSMIKRRADSAQ